MTPYLNRRERPAPAPSREEAEIDAFSRVSGMPRAYFAAAAALYPPAHIGALRVFLALRTASRRVDNVVGGWLGDSGMTTTKYDVLHLLLSAEPEGTTNAQLRDHLKMTQPNVSFVLASLERDGLIRRTRDPSDRRSSIVRATAKARRIVDRLTPLHLEAVASALSTIPAEQRTEFIQVLATIAERFEATPNPLNPERP